MLNPLQPAQLTADERKILSWLQAAPWEAQPDSGQTLPHKTKVPEFSSGVRLYRVQAGGATGGAQSPLELFLKKLEYQGVIGKQPMHPLAGHGAARFLSLAKAELDNLGVGRDEDDE
jgi:hypothetical protein